MHGISKHPKIRVDHKIEDLILLDSVSQDIVFEKKDCADKVFVSKGHHWTHSSGKRKSCIHLCCEISGVKGEHVLVEEFISIILSLADVADSHRVTMDTIIDYSFQAHTSKGIARHRHKKITCMHLMDFLVVTTPGEWKSGFDKEGTKGKKICLTNLIAEKFMLLSSPRSWKS